MQMNFTEALMIISSAFVLPMIAVFIYAFASGGIARAERAKDVVLLEDEIDYWQAEPATASAPRARQGGGDAA